MIGLGLRQLQEALDRKADSLQRAFVETSDKLQDIGGELLELSGEEREPKLKEQAELRARQQELAEEINTWRERSRKVLTTGGGVGLRAYLEELGTIDDPDIQAAVERALHFLEDPEAALEEYHAGQAQEEQDLSPAGRLLQRARREYDLRQRGSDPRRGAAFEFATRPGIAQDDELVREIEEAMGDEDEIVQEVATLTAIQLYRFRAMRTADLSLAHEAVDKLTKLDDPAAIPALIEVLENPRTGFEMDENGEPVEVHNTRTRMIALFRLVDWHTPEAQAALRGRQFDPSAEVTRAASRALEVFPGPWTGPDSKPENPGS